MSRSSVVWNANSQNVLEWTLDAGWPATTVENALPKAPTGVAEVWSGLRVPVRHPSLGGRGWTDCVWRAIALSSEEVPVAAGTDRRAAVAFVGGEVERCAWMESELQFWSWQNCVFREVDLRNARWSRVVFQGVQWQQSDWSYAQWDHCVFHRVRGWEQQGRHAEFKGCVFIGVENVAELLEGSHIFENAIWIDCKAPRAAQDELRKQGHVWVSSSESGAAGLAGIASVESPSVVKGGAPRVTERAEDASSKAAPLEPARPAVPVRDRFGSVERMGGGL